MEGHSASRYRGFDILDILLDFVERRWTHVSLCENMLIAGSIFGHVAAEGRWRSRVRRREDVRNETQRDARQVFAFSHRSHGPARFSRT